MEKIGNFLIENGEIIFCLLPVLAILVILFGVFIKMLVKNPKSMLGALFTVLGVIALYMAVALVVEEKNQNIAAMVFLAGVPAVWFTYKHPKVMLKIISVILGIVAVLAGIGYFFGIGWAVAVGFNGFFTFWIFFPAKWLKECIRLEKYGVRTEGEILSLRSCRGGKIPTFGFTLEDGTYVTREIGDICSNRANKLHETFTLVYDPDDTNKICAEKYTRIGFIVSLLIFIGFEAVVLGLTIFMFTGL